MINTLPLIGISGGMEHDESKQFIARVYMTAILAAGGLPLLLSVDMNDAQIQDCVHRLDGILFAGGTDVDPRLFGDMPMPHLGEVDPLRDRFELRLLKACIAEKIPVLGICRGTQLMNVALGGTLYQDLTSQLVAQTGTPAMLHSQTSLPQYTSHPVVIKAGTALSKIIETDSLEVNSLHHQAVKKPAPGLVVSAAAPDGVTEAIENPSLPFFLGVQWHPERIFSSQSEAKALFAAFLSASAQHHRAKEV